MNDMAASPIAHPDRFYIGGQWVEPTGTTSFDVITPATEELFVSVAEAQVADIDKAVAAARHAFDKGPWPRMSHVQRAEYVRKFAEYVSEGSPQMARSWASEMGIIAPFAEAMLGGVAQTYRFYADLANTYPWVEKHPTQSVDTGLLVREPVGVVAAIVPWNGPPLLVAWKIAPALLAGCTVILKASPEAPTAIYAAAEIAEKIGLPPGVLNVVTADREVSEALVRHPGVDKVTFTGSSVAGRRVASICGERIARCTLELGGKSAAIVLDDADAQTVAKGIAQNASMMTGQVCAALTRLVVPRNRKGEIVDALAAALQEIRVGDPLQQGTQMGPLAMSRQRDRVEHYLEVGKSEGARVVTGGSRPAGLDRGYFIEPTLFDNVDPKATIAQEEIFGPVVSVIAADSEEHAIDIANDTIFGLSGSVFTNDPERAYRVARQVRTGTIGQNGATGDFFSIAFGGFKQSGIGREGGAEGLRAFLEAKTILLNGMPSDLMV